MRFVDLHSDAAVLKEIGRRIARHRLERNWTQADLASNAGVGLATVQRAEYGRSIQLLSLIKLLRTIDLLQALDQAIPESLNLPIAELERKRPRQRLRAGRKRGDPTADADRWNWDQAP